MPACHLVCHIYVFTPMLQPMWLAADAPCAGMQCWVAEGEIGMSLRDGAEESGCCRRGRLPEIRHAHPPWTVLKALQCRSIALFILQSVQLPDLFQFGLQRINARSLRLQHRRQLQ